MWYLTLALLLMLTPVKVFSAGQEISFGRLREKLLVRALEDVFLVEAYPEMVVMEKTASIDLKFTTHHQTAIRKGQYLRVSYVNSYESPNIYEKKNSSYVFNVVFEILDKKMQPTGKSLNLGAKATLATVVGNFVFIEDIFTWNETLRAGRVQAGDYIINAFPTRLNGRKLAAYKKLKIVKVTKKYQKYTLYNNYTLYLRDTKTGRRYSLTSPGRRAIPTWSHLVAKGNERVIDIGIGEFHY